MLRTYHRWAGGINSKSLTKWYKNIETLITENEDPRTKLLRLFNFSDYQILSEEDRKPEKRQRGGLTQAELKKFFPDLYEEQQKLKEEYKISPRLQRQIDELKAEQKRIREEALEKMITMKLKQFDIEGFDSDKCFYYSYLILTGQMSYKDILEMDEDAAFIFNPTKPYVPMEDDVYDILLDHYSEEEDYEKCIELKKAKQLASIIQII